MHKSEYTRNGLHYHVEKLFPICRSITGKGIRETLSYFERYNNDFKRIKFKTGERVFDWEIPKEWNIEDAYIKHLESGLKFAEFKKNNLHIVNYSEPVNKILDLKEFNSRIHTSNIDNSYIPYVTSYYKKYWGFCLSKNDLNKLPLGKYKVVINSSFKNGTLELSHALLKGYSKKEILLSSYVCHPSMANNELSGPVILNALLDYIKKTYKKTKFSYRFLMVPETIGSISYISKYKKTLKNNVICGFNLSCVGDERAFSYVSTPFNNTLADKAIKAALIGKKNIKRYTFLERGSDERQFCSPGLRLPLCTFSRSKFGQYPEYHTSADNLELVTEKGLLDSFKVIKSIIDSFELGLFPKVNVIGEPQLGKRDLYPTISLTREKHPASNRMDFLTYADGKSSIFDIALITNQSLEDILNEYKIIKKAGLINS